MKNCHKDVCIAREVIFQSIIICKAGLGFAGGQLSWCFLFSFSELVICYSCVGKCNLNYSSSSLNLQLLTQQNSEKYSGNHGVMLLLKRYKILLEIFESVK